MKSSLRAFTFVFALGCGNLASAAPSSCPALFSQITKGTQALKLSVQFASMNQASKEFVTRLHYLISERRLFGTEAYRQVLNSPKPFNPLGEKPTGVVLLPHQTAFTDLLKEELQWSLIQDAARTLLGEATKDKEREKEAVRETAKTLIPIPIKEFPFNIERLVKTSDGQALALTAGPAPKSSESQITAYELPSGKETAKITFFGKINPWEMDVKVTPDTVLAAVPEQYTNKLMTIDLKKNAIISEPVIRIGPHDLPNLVANRAHFIEDRGRIEVATFLGPNTFFVDPIANTEPIRVEWNQPMNFERKASGAMGGSVFVSGDRITSLVMHSPRGTPTRAVSGTKILRSFIAHGKTYVLGIDQSLTSAYQNTLVLKTVELESRQESKTFNIPSISQNWPSLVQTFEQDGRTYGIIIGNNDVLLVDLIEGKVEQKLSHFVSPTAGQLNLAASMDQDDAIAFTFLGKSYLITIARARPEDRGHLAIVDPLTFTVVATSPELKEGALKIGVTTNAQNEPMAVVNYSDGTSSLFSLVSEPVKH